MIREINEPTWDETLATRGLVDVYLQAGYLAACAVLERGQPRLLTLDRGGSGVVFPVLVRPVPGGSLFDVTSPYGYGGPVGFGASPPWDEFHADYARWCEDMGVVTTFVRFHPLYGNRLHPAPAEEVELLAGTVAWTIAQGRDLGTGMHKEHRRSVRAAQAAGLRVTVRRSDADGLSTFRQLYESTMRGLEADNFYVFPDAYWQVLHEQLASSTRLAEARGEAGEVLAAALLFACKPWLHYHLSASTEEGRRQGATTLLLLEVARYAQDDGYEIFHLGGGRGGSADSLLRFKTRFDPGGLRPAALGKQVHDLVAYRRLAGTDSVSGYFPRYRSPTPSDP